MRMHVIWSTTIGALLWAGVASAQTGAGNVGSLAAKYVDAAGGLTVEEAVARAFAAEPLLRAARAEVEAARGLRTGAALLPNPAASIERREEPGGTDQQTSIGVEWPLELFRRGARARVADRRVEAAEHALEDRRRHLAADVRRRFGAAAAAVRLLAILDELVDATRRQHELLRARVEEGATPAIDRDLLAVELRRLDAERHLQAGRAEVALIELRRTVGMASDAPLALRGTLEELTRAPAPPGDPQPAAARGRADVRLAETEVAAAEARGELARREGAVDVTVFGSYMRMDAGFPQSGFGAGGRLERVRGLFNYVAGGLRVQLPLFDRNQGESAAARAETDAARARHEAAQLTAGAELASAAARRTQARRALDLYQEDALALAERNLTVVDESYTLGRATVYDVLAERRRFLEFQRSYTDTLLEAHEAATEWRRAAGDAR